MVHVAVIAQKVSNTNTKLFLIMLKTLAWFIVLFIHSLQELHVTPLVQKGD